VWQRYLSEVGKFYGTSKTLRINFYQNRSSIVDVMIIDYKNLVCSYASQWNINAITNHIHTGDASPLTADFFQLEKTAGRRHRLFYWNLYS